jgi:hypothetical protein
MNLAQYNPSNIQDLTCIEQIETKTKENCDKILTLNKQNH